MAVNFDRRNSQLGATISTIYTVPDNTTAIIEAITATNTDASARTIDLHLVASGDSADSTNKIIDAKSISMNTDEALDTVTGHNLQAGGTIQALADAASLVNLRVSFREIS